jgi:hypothetical protein
MARNRTVTYLLRALLAIGGTAIAGEAPERVADEGTIGDAWALADGTGLAQPQYPPQLAARGEDACIALAYRIGVDGSTSDFALIKAWTSDNGDRDAGDGAWAAYAQAGADAVSQWRFQPRAGITEVVPTRTVATLGFRGGAGGDPAQVNAHCRIQGLAEHLARLEGAQHRQRDDMARNELDRRFRMQRQSEKGFEAQGLRGRFNGERTGRNQ